MRDELLALLDEIDAWAAAKGLEALPVYLIGGGAMHLFWSRGTEHTRDLDVLLEPLRPHAELLEARFGRATGRDPYLDLVLAGLPVLPVGWRARAVQFSGPWVALSVHRLQTADQIASKLRSFRPQDRRDIQLLCDMQPEVYAPLASLSDADFWTAPDWWEDRIAPHRDRVLKYLRGELAEL